MDNSSRKNLIVGPLPPPVGGVSSAVVNLTNVLKQFDLDFEVFSTSSGRQREDLYASKNAAQYFNSIRMFFSFFYFLLSRPRNSIYHIFVVSNFAFLRDFSFLILAKLFRRKIIVHLHSKLSGELFLRKSLLPFFCKAIGLADYVFVLSKFHEEFFRKHINPHKVKVLENYVDSNCFKPTTSKNINWLYVGRLSEEKGFLDLLKAFDIVVNSFGFKSVKIDCLGVADTDVNQLKIEEFIDSKALRSNVILHGVVVGTEKFRYFSKNKGLIFTSHFENSPVVLKEAISAEMAIIASDIPANRNILDRVGNGKFFPVCNASALAKLIIYLESQGSEISTLQNAAKESFKYDIEYAASVINQVLNEI